MSEIVDLKKEFASWLCHLAVPLRKICYEPTFRQNNYREKIRAIKRGEGRVLNYKYMYLL
jgi:hypothetical protein